MLDAKTQVFNLDWLNFLFGEENAERGISLTPLDRTSDTIPIAPLPKREKDVCAELRKYWKDNGYFVIRNQQGIGSVKGLADYTIVRGSHVIFVEVKATKGKQSPYQKDFQSKLESVGGYYRLVHSLEEFLEGC